MIRLLTLTVLALVGINFSAIAQSCCSSSLAFADLGNDKEFVSSHDNPGNYKHVSVAGKMITFSTGGEKDANAFFLEKKGSDKWLFVIHEWWGLNDYVKKEAEKLYGDLKDVNVIAIDLYDGNVAKTREKAKEYMGMVTVQRAEEIIEGAIDMAGENAKISTIGWCFGGGWSLNASILASKKGVGCVVYYGMPTEEKEKLKKLEGPVLGIFASEDKWINKEVVETFASNMKDVNKKLTVHTFEANHAFANPSSESYKEKPAQSAYKLTLTFLKGVLEL